MTPPESSESIKYTRTGRVSKATKGQRVHHCEECGKVSILSVLYLTLAYSQPGSGVELEQCLIMQTTVSHKFCSLPGDMYERLTNSYRLTPVLSISGTSTSIRP